MTNCIKISVFAAITFPMMMMMIIMMIMMTTMMMMMMIMLTNLPCSLGCYRNHPHHGRTDCHLSSTPKPGSDLKDDSTRDQKDDRTRD